MSGEAPPSASFRFIVSTMTRTWVGSPRGVYGYYQDVVEPPPSAQPRSIGVEMSTVDHMKLQLKRLGDDTPPALMTSGYGDPVADGDH